MRINLWLSFVIPVSHSWFSLGWDPYCSLTKFNLLRVCNPFIRRGSLNKVCSCFLWGEGSREMKPPTTPPYFVSPFPRREKIRKFSFSPSTFFFFRSPLPFPLFSEATQFRCTLNHLPPSIQPMKLPLLYLPQREYTGGDIFPWLNDRGEYPRKKGGDTIFFRKEFLGKTRQTLLSRMRDFFC